MEIFLWLYILVTIIQIGFWVFVFFRLARYNEPSSPLTPKGELPLASSEFRVQSSEFVERDTLNLKTQQPATRNPQLTTNPKLRTQNPKPISIVICAKNESKNLQDNLPRILNQNDRSFEVLVVNDNSTDDSLEILTYLQQKHSHLRIINFSNKKKTQVGKKFALAKGIEEAKHEVLLLTDADCCPISDLWLQQMRATLHDTIAIGLGYAPYSTQPGFLNTIIRFETVYTAIQYLSFALAGLPYMGVGRNLIYKKSLFYQAKGFQKHEDLASGDDDLFINEVANAQNTAIVLKPETFMYSPPEQTWTAWFRQKSRHLTTGRRYQFKHKILLGSLSASHFLHFALGVFVAWKISFLLSVLIYVARLGIILPIFAAIAKKLQDRQLIKWFPILDAVFVIYYTAFAPILFFGKTKRWK